MNFTAKAASNATQAKIENTGVAAESKEKISMQAKAMSDGQVDAGVWPRGAEDQKDLARDQDGSLI